MTEARAAESAWVGVGAWLGAIVARLRAGRLPIPRGVSEQQANQDARSFGAVAAYQLRDIFGLCVPRLDAADSLLSEIHRTIRGRPYEEDLWHSILHFFPSPLPKQIALDLIERNMCRSALGHSWQHEEIWWKLADEVPEAAHNLALHRYINPEDDEHRLEEIFYAFPWYVEIAGVLSQYEPSQPSKARWLARYLRDGRVDSEDLRRFGKRSKRWHPVFAQAWERATHT